MDQPTHTALQKTPLHALHLAAGGKMVPFAGYDMPVQYDGFGVMKEHLHTRAAAGLFDVSHMGQCLFACKDGDPAEVLEKLVPGDIKGLGKFQMRYTVLLNDKGGIVDDLIVTRLDDRTLFLVINAGCKQKDIDFITARAGGAAQLIPLPDRALLALQGPAAADAIAAIAPDAARLTFMTAAECDHPQFGELFITRSGYTGEDGFEISVDADKAVALAETLLQNEQVKLIGLGARDSLRLEAGMCLYGHDLNDDTTPVEANLKWTIAKRRREEANFTAAAIINGQLQNGARTVRVGIRPDGVPLREGVALYAAGTNNKIGHVTSGGFSPTLSAPIAMGYIDAAHAATGTAIEAELRGARRACTISPLPFIQTRYKK